MLVSQKRTNDPSVTGLRREGLSRARVYERLEAYKGRLLAANRHTLFSPAAYAQFDVTGHPLVRAADVISLYWINGGFVPPEALALIGKPLLWRLSDVWPFTGGCHYPGSCERHAQYCGNCPQLRSPSEHDISRKLWQRKFDAWRKIDLTVVAPSAWMGQLARQSSLFRERRIEIVPTGVDISVFRPQDKVTLRSRLEIRQDRLVIAFGALDPDGDRRKGYAELNAALGRMARSSLAPRMLALIFGRDQLPGEQLPIPARFLGRLDRDEELAAAYASADIVAVPSTEDNLPNVALEAIACGVPVCGFCMGGMPEIVIHGLNGYLASPFDSNQLADNMLAILTDSNLRQKMAVNSRSRALRHFSLDIQAKAFAKLANEIADSPQIKKI